MTLMLALVANSDVGGILHKVARVSQKKPCRSSIALGFSTAWRKDFC